MKEEYSRLDNLLRVFADKQSVPGCACTILRGSEVEYEGCFGYADIASQKPVTRRSMFRQEEVTDLFTSVVLAMLYEEGKFIYCDPVGKYLPEWRNPKKYVVRPNGDVTVEPLNRNLTVRLASISMCGLPDLKEPLDEANTPTLAEMNRRLKPLYADGKTPTLREEVRALGGTPVMFEPYSHFKYGFGMQLAGAIVEEIEGKPLRQVFRERIIEPLGLEDTDTYITPENRDRVVTAYRKEADGSYTADPSLDRLYDPAQSPEGARPQILCSAADLATFMQMINEGGTYRGKKFLGKGTVNMLLSVELENPHFPDYLDGFREGYAFSMGFHSVVRTKYGHNGHLGNFCGYGGLGTWAEGDRQEDLAISYAHNMLPSENIPHIFRVRAVSYGCAL